MCGIFGIVQHRADDAPSVALLQETARLLNHRGPDGHGIYAEKGLGLVHTRLSLVDLSERSSQPFWDDTGRYALVYNGELYNFQPLKEQLQKLGAQFHTTSDTEVLLQSLIHLGIETTLARIEGMFAFAFYDKLERTLVLARDRLGIKPLFLYDDGETLAFASEVRALRPWVPLIADLLSISAYLQGGGGPTKGPCFFQGVRIVPPAAVIRVRFGQKAEHGTFFKLSQFWEPDLAEELRHKKDEQLVDAVDEALCDAVKSQLFADAPVGALCSGGVDSSLVMTMAAKFHPNLAIFHANVVGPTSEYEAAAALAKHLKLDLKSADVHEQDFIDLIPDVIEHYGYPFSYHYSAIPFLAVSRLVRANGVKAVLSGEGSDEGFHGYPSVVPNLPRMLKDVLSFKLTRYAHRKFVLSARQVQGLPWQRMTPLRVSHSDYHLLAGLHDRFDYDFQATEIATDVSAIHKGKLRRLDLKSLTMLTYHLRTLLHRNDTLGMAASIEARFPFLDHRVLRLAVNLPYRSKVRLDLRVNDRHHRFLRDKWVIRKVAARYMPRLISHRRKRGFPTTAFQRMHVAPEFFQGSFVADLFELPARESQFFIQHATRELTVKLMLLEVWAHTCLHGLPKEDILRRLRQHISVRPYAGRGRQKTSAA